MALVYRYHYPTRTRAELGADACAHLLGFIWAFSLFHDASSAADVLRACVLTTLFCTSAAYHLTPVEGPREHLRRIDHAMIFLVIPIVSYPVAPDSPIFWVLGPAALISAIAKLYFGHWRDDLSQAVYISLSIASVAILIAHVPLVTLGVSILCLVIGLCFFNAPRIPFHMALWHVCVVLGLAVVVG